MLIDVLPKKFLWANKVWKFCILQILSKDLQCIPHITGCKRSSIKNRHLLWISPMRLAIYRALQLQAWSVDQQNQHHPGVCYECRIAGNLGPTVLESSFLTRSQVICLHIKGWKALLLITVWKMVSCDPRFWHKSSHMFGAPGANEQAWVILPASNWPWALQVWGCYSQPHESLGQFQLQALSHFQGHAFFDWH